MNESRSPNPYAAPAGLNWDAGVDIVNAVAVDADGSLTVDYDVTIEDVVAFTLYRHRTSPVLRGAFRRSWLVLPPMALLASLLLAYVLRFDRSLYLTTLATGGVMAIILTVFYPWLYRNRTTSLVRRIYREGKNDNVLGPHRMVLTPTALTDLTANSKTAWKWAGIDRIEQTTTAAYFYLASLTAFLIPRRAFSSDDEFRAFVETARRFQAGFKA